MPILELAAANPSPGMTICVEDSTGKEATATWSLDRTAWHWKDASGAVGHLAQGADLRKELRRLLGAPIEKVTVIEATAPNWDPR